MKITPQMTRRTLSPGAECFFLAGYLLIAFNRSRSLWLGGKKKQSKFYRANPTGDGAALSRPIARVDKRQTATPLVSAHGWLG
jgi:hypothetical protein